jgi:hypothetical protein
MIEKQNVTPLHAIETEIDPAGIAAIRTLPSAGRSRPKREVC